MHSFCVRICVLIWSFIAVLAEAQRDPIQESSALALRSARREAYSSASLERRREKKKKDGRFFSFVTRPDIGAPRWNIEYYDKDAVAPGYFFMAPYAHLDQFTYPLWNGPHIYDQEGELIWSGATMFEHFNTFDFRIVEVQGKPMLSLLFPHDEHQEGVIIDDRYEIYGEVDLLGKLDKSNMHDFTVSNNGSTALTLTEVHEHATQEQSAVVGYDGECHAAWEGFKELEVATSKVLFEWSAKDWIGLDETTFIPHEPEEQCKKRWDILHLNSIDKFDDGDYLVSSRHTDTVYKVSHEDGHIVWRLGGVKSDFELSQDDGTKFSRQHHARFRGQNETHTLVSIFDNAVGSGPSNTEHATSRMSRGILLALRTDTTPMTAELVHAYNHPEGLMTNSRGSVQFLDNGNAFVGWTYSSRQSEHAEDGRLLMKANLKKDSAHSYRNYKYEWVGHPSLPPDVHSEAIEKDGRISTVVHVSWNGATEVTNWRLFKTTGSDSVEEMVASEERKGFETRFEYEGYASFIFVQALDVDSQELGRSKTVKTISSSLDLQSYEVEDEIQWLEDHGASLEDEPLTGDEEKAGPIPVEATYFIFGFVTSAVMILCCGAIGFAIRRSSRDGKAWWRRQSATPPPAYETYAPVNGRDQDDGEPEQSTGEQEKARLMADEDDGP